MDSGGPRVFCYARIRITDTTFDTQLGLMNCSHGNGRQQQERKPGLINQTAEHVEQK